MKDIGGELSVSLSEIEIQNSIQDLNINPGRYLKLVVDDTGFGMPPEILNKIFEPYFTTKRVGEGTGLGLAVVLGIIEDHNGHIKAYSATGKGSSFHVYLPIFKNDPVSSASLGKENKVEGGTERIMLIDDEESILTSTSELLKNYGYDVKGFCDADIAFNAFENNNLGFDLIITDMTMPGMSGDEFAQKSLALRNDIPIILCTGFSNNMSKNKALKLGIKEYVQKPIDGEKMLLMIRKILDNNQS